MSTTHPPAMTPSSARPRHARPGVDLTSPPPLHDIYSIEDLKLLNHERGELRRWNLAAGTMVRLGSPGPTSQAELSPEGRTVALTGDSNQIRLIDVASGAERALTGHADQVYVMEFSPDGTRLASGSGHST